MATEIVTCFYFDASIAVETLFEDLVRTVAAWPQTSGEWRGFKVAEGRRTNAVVTSDGTLTTDDLIARSRGHGGESRMLSARTSFRCWRFQDGEPQAGSVVLVVEAWGESFGRAANEDLRLSGLAQLSIMDVGPFCALLEEATTPRTQGVNARVEENVEAFTGLLFRAIESLSPRSAKVFTDQGLFLPFNAHVVYYRSDDDVVADLRFLRDLWDRGLPKHGVPALDSQGASPHPAAFHHWRSATAQVELWQRLAERMDRVARVTPEMIARVRTSGRFDTYTMPTGVTILDYPHPFNAFLDRFFLDVLGEVAAQP